MNHRDEGAGVEVRPISDGTFRARPSYFGVAAAATRHLDVFDARGVALLPIGCFLIRTSGRSVLVDAGLGPQRQPMPDGMELVGGQLLTGLAAAGSDPNEMTDVVCTHLHADHVGWLFDRTAELTFSRATIWFGAADWEHFVDGPGEMAPHIRAGFHRHEHASRLRPLEQQADIAPGVTVFPTPGHTPGHLGVMVDHGARRSLLLGDAVTHPVQLDRPTWHSFGDTDPGLAERTREQLWGTLRQPDVVGTGAHFPGLRFGHVGAGRHWST